MLTVISVVKFQVRYVMWLCRTKELSPSDSGQLSPVGSSSNPSPPDESGSPVGTSVESTTFLDPYIPGGRPVDGTVRPPPPHNMAPVGVMNMQQPFTHQLPFGSSSGGHHLSLFSDSGFVSSRQAKPSFDQPVTGRWCFIIHVLTTISHSAGSIVVSISRRPSFTELQYFSFFSALAGC